MSVDSGSHVHLTKPNRYNIEDSNIALLGSDLEKRVREHAGDKEPAWNESVGAEPGLQIWRIQQFKVVPWPEDKYGSFYDGDSYIVLHTYKKTPESESLSYDLHFWLGEDTTQDEAGTAAYKTVELDDHLHGAPVQYREIQSQESSRFLSYFPRFLCLTGGVSTGFHHVSEVPPPDTFKLYQVSLSRTSERGTSNLVVRQVRAEASSLVEGDVYVLDKGNKIWQFNSKESVGKEKFKAAEFTQLLAGERQGMCDVTVYDEGSSGAHIFLSELGAEKLQPNPHPPLGTLHTDQSEPEQPASDATLYRISDSDGGAPAFESLGTPSASLLSSSDAFLLDDSSSRSAHPAIYVWLGQDSSGAEKRHAIQYAQDFVHRQGREGVKKGVSIVKMREGSESEEFVKIMGM